MTGALSSPSTIANLQSILNNAAATSSLANNTTVQSTVNDLLKRQLEYTPERLAELAKDASRFQADLQAEKITQTGDETIRVGSALQQQRTDDQRELMQAQTVEQVELAREQTTQDIARLIAGEKSENRQQQFAFDLARSKEQQDQAAADAQFRRNLRGRYG